MASTSGRPKGSQNADFEGLQHRLDADRHRLDRVSDRESDHRAYIVQIVMGLFAVAVVLGLSLPVVQGVRSGDWHDPMVASADLLKSVVLPIVTLILGYYFGRASKG